MIFNSDSAIKHSYSNDDICFSIDVIDEIIEEDFNVLLNEGSKILHSIKGTILEEEIFSEFDKFIAMTVDENYNFESDTEEPPFEKITINIDYKIKTSLEEPPTDLKLKPLPDNLEYVFLEEPSFLPVIIPSQLSAQNKKQTYTFQRCMLAIFHDMIEESVKVFMDDFFVFGNSFDKCLNNLNKILQHCKDAHLVLNWEKYHFMVKEGIVLGHKVSGAGLEVDKAKIDIKDKKGIENVAADHLSRIDNNESSDESKVDDNFLGETLMEIDTRNEPCNLEALELVLDHHLLDQSLINLMLLISQVPILASTPFSAKLLKYLNEEVLSNTDDKSYDLQRQFNDFIKSQQSTNAFVKETFMDLKTQQETVAKNHQALIQNLETKFDRLADKQSGRPSGSLPSNTQPNPRGNNSKAYQPPQSRNEHVNAVFTRSGKSYDPPDNPNDQQNNSENPINFDSDDEDDEPTPQPKTQPPKPVKETPLPKPYKPKIPYPQRLRKEKMEAQYGKFLDMIRAVRINVPLVDVLAGMPNYGKFLKELISNKHKIEQISAAFLSDESSAILQNKVPPKLGDPGSFLIPCNFNKTFSCNALADLGASINLMPYSLYAKLSLETLKPTKMSVRLANRSFQYPVGIAENMLIEVGKFTFLVDFVILKMEEDSKVPLILGRPFLHTADAVIRVKQKNSILDIDVIDEIFEEDFDALLNEGSKILHSIKGTVLEKEIFSEFNKFIAMTVDENYNSKSDTKEPPFEKITINIDYKIKTSLEEPPTDLKLKPLPDNLEYVFLEEPSFLPVIIPSQLSAQNKSKLVSVLKNIRKHLPRKQQIFLVSAHHSDRMSTPTQCCDMGSDGYAYPVYDMFGIVDPNMQNEIDTFYNSLSQADHDSLNSAAGVLVGSSAQDAHISSLTKQVEALLALHRPVDSTQNGVNSIQNGCETCGGPHPYFECQATGGYTQDGVLPSNTVPNPREDLKAITTRSGVTLAGPSVPPPLSSSKEPSPASTELPHAPVSSLVIPEPKPHQPSIPYPSRLNKEKLQGKADIQIHSFLHMFKKIHFNISFAEALAHMPKFAKMIKDLLTNKEKLLEMVNTPLNENCSAVLLKKLPEKLGDTRRFLIPCDFYGLESCMALADLGPKRGICGLCSSGKFTFPADFVVVDYEVDPRVPLILGRPFLRTAHALVDVHGEKLTLRVGDEELVFNVESTSKYPRKHGDESIHKIDILDITCEDHFHEVLNVQKSINPMSGSPTPSPDPVVESLSPSLTPFGDSDFLLEETDAFLSLDDSIPPGIDNGIYDSEGDILFLEELLNEDPTPNLPPIPHPVCLINETEKIKSSIDDPPDLKLKDLPPHLEYAYLEDTSKLPVIIVKDLKREEKEQLLKVLKSHKRAIAWKISDIQGIDPNFCTHKILMEDDFKPAVQHQRRVNPKIHEVIKAEVIKLLDAGLIYPISDSPWVSPIHVVPKKGGMTVITNENNVLIPT
ncbi:reverse transcriptase domain-containing protein [Tanacetum coccineum]